MQSQAKNDFIHSKFWLRMILFIAGYGRFCFRFDPMIGERERERQKNRERVVRRDGWRGWCKSRRKAWVKLNSHEPRVSLNSIPEMEVIIITSGSGWRLRQLWLMPLWLFGVLLFSRDAPKESNDVSTIPKQAADADNCSLECQATWAETAATPKPRKLRPGSKKAEPASKPKRLCLCLA